MNTKKIELSMMTAVIFLAAVLLAVYAPWQNTMKAGASIYTGTILQKATTSAAVTVTSSTRILATTTSITGDTSYTRVYASICNPSNVIVYLRMDQDKAASNANGIPIAAAAGYSACYEITDRNMYQGSVKASSTSETSTSVIVNDYVQ